MSKADPNGSKLPLNGLKVLVTRPAGQAASFIEAIQAQGGIPQSFPLIEIQPIAHCPETLAQITNYDLAIFVSRNAVECAWPLVAGSQLASIQVAAVGQATAVALARHGRQPDIVPTNRFDSEGLLGMPELEQVANKRILIIRGQGGRELLADSLRERGAKVDYAEVYQRLPTQQVLTYGRDEIDVIVITSAEALAHLQQIASQTGKRWLLEKPLLVIHERVARRANELGFTLNPVVAAQASEAALLDALQSMQY